MRTYQIAILLLLTGMFMIQIEQGHKLNILRQSLPIDAYIQQPDSAGRVCFIPLRKE